MKDMWLLLAGSPKPVAEKSVGWTYQGIVTDGDAKAIIYSDYCESVTSIYYYNTSAKQDIDVTVMDNVNLNGLYSLFDLSDIPNYQNGGYYTVNGTQHPFTESNVVTIGGKPYLKNPDNEYISLVLVNHKNAKYEDYNSQTDYILLTDSSIEANDLLYGGTITFSDDSTLDYDEDDLISINGTVYIKITLPSGVTVTSFTANDSSSSDLSIKSFINLDGVNGYLSGGKINFSDNTSVAFSGTDAVTINKHTYIVKDNADCKDVTGISVITALTDTTKPYDGTGRCKTAIPFTSYPSTDSIYQYGGDKDTDIPVWDQLTTNWDRMVNYYYNVPYYYHSPNYSGFDECSVNIVPSGTMHGYTYKIPVPIYVYNENEDWYVYSHMDYRTGGTVSPVSVGGAYTPAQALKQVCSSNFYNIFNITDAEYQNKQWYVSKCYCYNAWRFRPNWSLPNHIYPPGRYYPPPPIFWYYPPPHIYTEYKWKSWATYQEYCDGWDTPTIRTRYVIVNVKKVGNTFQVSDSSEFGAIGYFSYSMDFCCNNVTTTHNYIIGGSLINGKVKIGRGCVTGLVGTPWRITYRNAPGSTSWSPASCPSTVPSGCDCPPPKLYDYYYEIKDYYIRGGGGCSQGAARSNSVVVSRLRYIDCTSDFENKGVDYCSEQGKSYNRSWATNYVKGCGSRYSVASGLIKTEFTSIIQVKRGTPITETGYANTQATVNYSGCCCGAGTDFSIGVTNSSEGRRCISLPQSVSNAYSGMHWTVYERNYNLTYNSGTVGTNGATGAPAQFCADNGYNGYMRIRITC